MRFVPPYPEAFADNVVDLDKLGQLLGERTSTEPERYSLSWSGRAAATRNTQTGTSKTLRPVRSESVNFDVTDNLIIEGDNLDAIKLLRYSYRDRVKLIYVDPPYNTGKDFIYNDNYRQGEREYMEDSGQADADGARFVLNTETAGRFHARWLSMMYPRLVLAKTLLREDGVIAISVDDYEVANLRLLLDEVFGRENFLAQVIWNLKTGRQAGHFTRSHEYIVFYARRKERLPYFGTLETGTIKHGALKSISAVNPASEITFPEGMEFEGADAEFVGTVGDSEKQYIVSDRMVFRDGKLAYPVVLKAGWAMRDQILSWLDGEETYDSKDQLVKRFFFNSSGILWYEKERGTVHPKTVWTDVAKTKDGTDELKALLGGKYFEFPKPSALLKYLARIVTSDSKDAIVLDFFAGSGTTAHAVIELNKEDGGNRSFILVQYPESTRKAKNGSFVETPASEAGYATVADITKERVRRVIAEVTKDSPTESTTLGFRVVRIDESNFKMWNPAGIPREADELATQLVLHAENVLDGRSEEDILYEVMLKAGLGITGTVERRDVEGSDVYVAANGRAVICLKPPLDVSAVRAICAMAPGVVICLDSVFDGRDDAKCNAALELRERNIVFHTV